ncbi:hypothetical protein PRIC1_011951 [Phytophthora ramorum]
MRLRFALLLVAAVVLVACSEASSLRQGSVTKPVTSNDDTTSEERIFMVHTSLAEKLPKALPVDPSKWQKFRDKLAKVLFPDTSNIRLVYKGDGKWKSKPY